MDKRWSRRQKINCNVDILIGGKLHASTTTVDIGLGGVFLKLKPSLQPGDARDLELLIKDLGPVQLSFLASVTRQDTSGIACQFQNVSTTEQVGLKKLLSLN